MGIIDFVERQHEELVAEQRKNRYLKTDEQKAEYRAKKREYMRRYKEADPEKVKKQNREAQRRYRERMK